MSAKINKSYCQDLLDNDNKKAIKNGLENIKEQIKTNNIKLAKIAKNLDEFKDDEFFIERLENQREVVENWNKSLEYHLQLIFDHYQDL